MSNNQFPYTPALKPFQDADDAWSLELQRIFGKDAGDARYQKRGEGEQGSVLHCLYATRHLAYLIWQQSAY